MFAWIATVSMSLLAIAAGCWLWVHRQRAYAASRLMTAIREADPAELSILLREGADLRTVPEWSGEPAVIVAVKAIAEGRQFCQIVEVLRLLLAYGADVDERGTEWKTAFMYAAAEGHRQMCDLLLSAGADSDARDALGRTAAWRHPS